MVIYLSKNKLFRFLLIMVIVISILSIFPISLKNIAEDVVSVISGGRLIPIYAVDTRKNYCPFF